MARIPMRTVTVPAWWADEASAAPLLIELTAKRWKALMLVAVALMALGFLMLGWQLWAEVYRPILDLDQSRAAAALQFTRLMEAMSGAAAWIGWLLVLAGTVLGIYARFMAWWRHG